MPLLNHGRCCSVVARVLRTSVENEGELLLLPNHQIKAEAGVHRHDPPPGSLPSLAAQALINRRIGHHESAIRVGVGGGWRASVSMNYNCA